MDPSEILKAAEIVKRVAPVAAVIPFTGIVKRMLGPAADELAEMWKDQIRLYRYGRQMKCIEKAEKMAHEAGFTPNAVPPKILFPLLEGASLEDDEGLHTMWAALLANASSKMGTIVRPSFISLLRNMAPDEAELLKQLSERDARIALVEADLKHQYDLAASDNSVKVYRVTGDAGAKEKVKGIRDEFRKKFRILEGEEEEQTEYRHQSCLATLEEAGFLKKDMHMVIAERSTLRLTGRGVTFLTACSPPRRRP